jgi:hypothetical protein
MRNGTPLNFDFFPSTAQVASIGLYRRHPAAYKRFLDQITGGVGDVPLADYLSGAGDDSRSDANVAMEFYRRLDAGGPGGDLKTLRADYEDYHKYFCIVHADGDRFGKVITGLGNDHAAIKNFSGELAAFAAAAARIINDFGGKPIYIGGDDLLFFAPVVFYRQQQDDTVTVFDCIDAIDEQFKTHKFDPQPSLSYGVTMSHYKYPLFEARDASYDRMMAAKGTVWGHPNTKAATTKDAISFRLIRHSGSFFEGFLDKQMLKRLIVLRQQRTEADFLSSFTFKLRELDPLLDALGEELTGDRLTAIAENFFDEPIHRQYQTEIERLIEFYQTVSDLPLTVNGKTTSARDNAYALMRLLAFTLPQKASIHVPTLS